MKHSRILLIDHDGEDIESVTHSLINLGIGSTVVARSEYEALDDIKNRNPELIIMNITESGLNRSLVLARRIRSGHNKPILYLAPNSEKSSLIEANLLTSNNYLLKPFIGTGTSIVRTFAAVQSVAIMLAISPSVRFPFAFLEFPKQKYTTAT